MKVVLVLALLGAAYAAVPRFSDEPSDRIAGGEDATIEQYPYMTNMQYGVLGILWYQTCGGSLITNDVSLSAAHCYYGDRADQWRVVLGSSFVASGGTTIRVLEFILHPGFSPGLYDDDVALVRLETPLFTSETIGLARIAGPLYVLPDYTQLTVLGYGLLYSNGPNPVQLQKAEVNIINQELCAKRYEELKTMPGYENSPNITNNMLCTGILDQGGKDACQGDFGGPAIHDSDVVFGITSWGYECADAYYPTVSIRVNQYTDWIISNA